MPLAFRNYKRKKIEAEVKGFISQTGRCNKYAFAPGDFEGLTFSTNVS